MSKNPLTDAIPAKARKYVYAVVFVVSLAWGAWQGADGDWNKAVAALLPLIVSALAASNISS